MTALIREFGVPPDKITVIRNWTHVATPPPDLDRAAVRAELGWGPDEIIVLHTGAMGAKQGLENVVEAARLADHRDVRVRFVLVGDGSRRGALEDLAQGVGRIQFGDPVDGDKYMPMLAAADVLLLNELPSISGMAIPSKLTSYFASGRPVLAATDSGSASASEVRSSGAGLVVRPGDPGALLQAALDLAASGEAESMGENGMRYVRETLSPETATQAYVAWVESLIGGSADRRGTEA